MLKMIIAYDSSVIYQMNQKDYMSFYWSIKKDIAGDNAPLDMQIFSDKSHLKTKLTHPKKCFSPDS